MVSQPETSSSVSYRGPSSVVSRPSLSRTKRYNRSHVGGASYIPQNEFPVFSQSGDVEIVIRVTGGSVENRYLLHRHTLTRCSGFFEASTSEQWSKARPLLAGGNELARIGEHDTPTGSLIDSDTERGDSKRTPGSGGNESRDAPRTKVPSIFGPGDDTMRPSSRAMSRSKGSHSQSASVSSNRDFFRSVANLGSSTNGHHNSSSSSSSGLVTKAEQDLMRDYDNLFRTMYNYPPVLDGINVADAYVQCKSLLNLADQYDALGVVGPRVDHHLLQFQSRLWRQIAKYPISYLRLGYLAKSKVIFQEALIHVVGQWPAGERSLRTALPEVVLDIIEDKVDELEETTGSPSVYFANGLQITPHLNLLLPTVGRREMAPVTYLNHDECKKFLKLTPEMYTRDNLRRFEKRIEELKSMARDIVRPLMNSGLELELSGSSKAAEISYLTCTEVGNRDLPWAIEN
uniref:BTB domain-containing protein n=1 Tax=Bionectria ochroleuca TaxID=29856 RepID=A0A8H7N2P2_BIOOC